MKLQINEFERVAKVMVGFPPGQGSATSACRFKDRGEKTGNALERQRETVLPCPPGISSVCNRPLSA
jgi:hypothetical protein